MLGTACLGPHRKRPRIKRKIASADIHSTVPSHGWGRSNDGLGSFRRFRWTANDTANGTGRAVDSVVETKMKRVHQPLHVGIAESCEHTVPLVRHSIAIDVFKKEDLRGIAHKHSAVVAADGRGPSQTIRKHCSPVVHAVVVVVMKQPHPPQSLSLTLAISPHFGYEQSAILVPSNRHRTRQERFVGRQLDLKFRLHPQRRDRRNRVQWRHARQLGGEIIGPSRCPHEREAQHNGDSDQPQRPSTAARQKCECRDIAHHCVSSRSDRIVSSNCFSTLGPTNEDVCCIS